MVRIPQFCRMYERGAQHGVGPPILNSESNATRYRLSSSQGTARRLLESTRTSLDLKRIKTTYLLSAFNGRQTPMKVGSIMIPSETPSLTFLPSTNMVPEMNQPSSLFKKGNYAIFTVKRERGFRRKAQSIGPRSPSESAPPPIGAAW
jgi:hypothetical protein